MIGYIFYMKKINNIKYKIGKRYKFTKTFINYNVSPCGFKSEYIVDDFYSNDKIYKIKIYDKNTKNITRDFKILQEINYKDLLNSKDKYERIISAIKNREESVLNNFIKSDAYYKIRTIIKSRVYKYLDKLTTTKDEKIIPYIPYLIEEMGRNKDLDNFINCNNDEIKCQIANVGRPKDLNILINSRNFYAIHSVLKNGRSKDIDKYMEDIEDCFYCSSIIKTGIDKYLDEFINNENDYSLDIVEQGRKCDLDILVYNKDQLVKETVARHGFDDHLDILEKENNYNINQIIDELRGKREI